MLEGSMPMIALAATGGRGPVTKIGNTNGLLRATSTANRHNGTSSGPSGDRGRYGYKGAETTTNQQRWMPNHFIPSSEP